MWPAWAPQPGHRSTKDPVLDTRRRIEMWKDQLPGGCYSWPPLVLPDPRALPEFRPAAPAVLTELGEKLLGLPPRG